MYNDDEILKNIENNRYFNFVFRIGTTVAAANHISILSFRLVIISAGTRQ